MASLSQAFVPQFIGKSSDKKWTEIASLLAGLLALTALAQVSIKLPWTPVPITGQTLGVSLISLTWGRKRAFAILSSYLAFGGLGLPIFANGASGFNFGPTSGYLFGMIVACFVMGGLADRGMTKSFPKALGATYLGSALVFTFGLWGLSFFVPKDQLLITGLLPFLPGDLLKNLLSASLVTGLASKMKSRESASLN